MSLRIMTVQHINFIRFPTFSHKNKTRICSATLFLDNAFCSCVHTSKHVSRTELSFSFTVAFFFSSIKQSFLATAHKQVPVYLGGAHQL